jgi:ATP-dependent RNA helicase UAP56/SUB2
MSSHDNEELIDYEDEHDVIPNGAVAATSTNGAAASAVDGEGDKDKKNFSGIHSTGFRFIFLCDHKICSFANYLIFIFSQGLLVET